MIFHFVCNEFECFEAVVTTASWKLDAFAMLGLDGASANVDAMSIFALFAVPIFKAVIDKREITEESEFVGADADAS